jgi:hypothetical protein
MVEKKVGKAGAKVSAEVFRKACREYATIKSAIKSSLEQYPIESAVLNLPLIGSAFHF